MTDPLVRPFAETDVEAVRALVREALRVERPPSTFLNDLHRARQEAWVLVVDDRLCGWLSFAWVLDEMELHEVAVAADMRGNGYGRLLMSHLYGRARRHGMHSVHLEVRAGNRAARTLYGGDGFVEVGCRRAYYPDGEDAVLYSLSLGAGGA